MKTVLLAMLFFISATVALACPEGEVCITSRHDPDQNDSRCDYFSVACKDIPVLPAVCSKLRADKNPGRKVILECARSECAKPAAQKDAFCRGLYDMEIWFTVNAGCVGLETRDQVLACMTRYCANGSDAVKKGFSCAMLSELRAGTKPEPGVKPKVADAQTVKTAPKVPGVSDAPSTGVGNKFWLRVPAK